MVLLNAFGIVGRSRASFAKCLLVFWCGKEEEEEEEEAEGQSGAVSLDVYTIFFSIPVTLIRL